MFAALWAAHFLNNNVITIYFLERKTEGEREKFLKPNFQVHGSVYLGAN